jgi:hypothetical protein
VGEDGVIVIRNLHLENYDFLDDIYDNFYEPTEIGDTFEPDIRPDERKNYTDIHVITYNGIVEDIVCYWCAPDEKWDKKQGLILSADGKELRRCIKIDLKTCILPYGVEVVNPNAFIGGIYMPGEGYDNELESIYLPSTIKEIDENVFSDLNFLKEIIVDYGSLEKFRSMLPKYISIIREENDLP